MAEADRVAIPNETEGPVEGAPVLPEILAEAQRKLESMFPSSTPLPVGEWPGVRSGPSSLPSPRGGGAGGGVLEFTTLDDSLEVTIEPERLSEVCSAIRNDLGYRMLMSITAVDWKSDFELVYHVYRLDSAFPIVLRCRVPHDEHPEIASLVPIWPGADFQEREIYDLMGIVFTGHPDLRRILLADDFQGHPLRKDFEQDPEYVLVPHLRIPGYAGAKRGETSTGRFLSD